MQNSEDVEIIAQGDLLCDSDCTNGEDVAPDGHDAPSSPALGIRVCYITKTFTALFSFLFPAIPDFIISLLSSLLPSRNLDPGSQSYQAFLPPPHYGSRLGRRFYPFLPSSTINSI